MRPDVCVVIPTYRRRDLLDRCLRAVADQDYPPSQYEIVVADDGAEKATELLVRELSGRLGVAIRYLAVTQTQGPAAARNVGWRSTDASIIAFTDDDCVPDRRWLSAGVQGIRDRSDAIAGRVVMPLPERPTDYERDAAGLTRAEFVTANCFVRRTALEAVGGFDERFRAAWREDSDLQFSLLKKGFVIRRSDEAVVLHPIRPGAWGISLKQQAKSQFDALLRRKHPEMYRERIGRFPMNYVAINVCLVACVMALLLGQFSAALPPFAMWCALTASFFWQRIRGASLAPAHVAEMLFTSIVIPPVSLYWHLRGLIRFRTVAW